jgi:gliding motility-associated lipoprotein GldH
MEVEISGKTEIKTGIRNAKKDKPKMRKFLMLSGITILLFSCAENVVYTESEVIAGGSWSKDKEIRFQITDPDTVNAHNIYIAMRNDNTYPYSNLYLIVDMDYPDGSRMRDTLEYKMADPAGNWLGSGSINTIENKLGYKRNIVFPTKGVYNLSIAHAMRENGKVTGIESLPGILDLGIQVEKNPEN